MKAAGTTPFFTGYRPVYFRTTDVTGNCTLPAGVECACPATMNMTVELIAESRSPWMKAFRFAIREGGKTVGSGRRRQILP